MQDTNHTQPSTFNLSPSASIKACLFDLDGVLVDTAVYHYKAWKRLANTMGFDFTEEQNEQLKGVSRVESLNKILAWGGVDKTDTEKEELATLKNSWYVDMIAKMTPAEVLPGTVDFLTTIHQAGYKLALGSASKNSAIILERTQLAHFFDEIVDGNRVTKSKPDPEVFLKGAELLGFKPEECVVFEDAVAGVEAAKRGGMKAIGIGEKSVLTKADKVVSGLDKLTVKDLEEL
ncbi:beta-phosphoglucomutase [Pedobacter sp. HDW13]|uniref:beta-phosphoglucomutase n=1 Tax=unclassified Pedobacter TaxID=2628915 RepID=UPI000F5AA27B|nr:MULTISPECIES: beta-phosphoglucomutase [unclassified Pedobacter]QIL40044.1 beta-phosphoglucomutase [Pedobacter sp. HDW13]RQO68288.1 beta-phosphoglucomutase [Pedobacter sp. KBW01]